MTATMMLFLRHDPIGRPPNDKKANVMENIIENSKAGGIKNVGCLLIFALVGFVIYGLVKLTPSEEESAACRQRIESTIQSAIPPSIAEMDEVDWVEYEGREVYIGFNVWPDDIQTMISAWAIQANKALDRRVSVIAVLNEDNGWRMGERVQRYVMITARDGEITNITP